MDERGRDASGENPGPDPQRVRDRATLAAELKLLQARAARGRGMRTVSYQEITRLLALPASNKSTIANYMSGKTLPPPDVLDNIVIALGVPPEEQRAWADAWDRVTFAEGRLRVRGAGATEDGLSAFDQIASMLDRTITLNRDVVAVSANNLDDVFAVQHIGADHEEHVEAPRAYPGGSGANTGAALGRLGFRVGVIGAIGDDREGSILRESLSSAGVDTSTLLEVSIGIGSGRTMVFTDGRGQRLIYVRPGANQRFAYELRSQGRVADLNGYMDETRWVHLSSFTSSSERVLQETLAGRLFADQVLSVTPGTLYSKLGADRLAGLLRRSNVVFLYENQLDALLAGTASAPPLEGADLIEKMRRFYAWRGSRGPVHPLLLVVKRPSGLREGRVEQYLSIGCGKDELDEFTGPDAGSRRREIIDATGAGDALAAGVIAGLLSRMEKTACCNLSFLMALCASSAIGARTNLPSRSSIRSAWISHLPDVEWSGELG